MRYIFFAVIFLLSSLCIAQVIEPEKIQDALGLLPVLFSFIKNGQWLLAGAAISLIVTFVSRHYIFPKIKVGDGVLPIYSALVGCLAGVSLAVLNNATLGEATIAVMSGPAASLLWDSAVKYFFQKK